MIQLSNNIHEMQETEKYWEKMEESLQEQVANWPLVQ